MRRLGFLFLLAFMAAMPALPASADPYRFEVSDPDATLGGQPFDPYYFFLDSAPLTTVFDADSFTLDGTTFGHTFSDVAVLDSFTFYTAGFGGGFDDLENVYEGPALFTGPTDAPVFQLGTYALDDFVVPVTLTISKVPEPMSLALFGGALAGAFALRRRRVKV